LIQRVKKAKININEQIISQIGKGLLLFVGVGIDDQDEDIDYLVKKTINLRIFEDASGKMNLNIKQICGQILSVPQFTLYANTQDGNRPGFELAASGQVAKELWLKFNRQLKGNSVVVSEGVFGQHMDIELINDGPVTIWLDSKSKA